MNFLVTAFAVAAQLVVQHIGWNSDISLDFFVFYSADQNKRKKCILCVLRYLTHILLHAWLTSNTFWYTPLNCLSLITISLEKVQELSSFMLKRVLKYTVIKMHSASFFANGLNGAYKLVRCVAFYISVEKTDKPSNTPCLYRFYSVVITMCIGPLHLNLYSLHREALFDLQYAM